MPVRRKRKPDVEMVSIILPKAWLNEIQQHVNASAGERGWRGNVNKSDIIRRALRKGLDAMKGEVESAAQ